MSIFSKPEYKELFLPFRYVRDPEADAEAGIIDIEACGDVFGEEKYCLASYSLAKHNMYESGDYQQLLELLNDTRGKSVKVIFKFKNDKLKSFKIDLDSLAEAYHDERFKAFELAGWGLNDKPFEEIINAAKF